VILAKYKPATAVYRLKPFERPGPESAISKELLQKWIQTEQSGENKHAAVTILEYRLDAQQHEAAA